MNSQHQESSCENKKTQLKKLGHKANRDITINDSHQSEQEQVNKMENKTNNITRKATHNGKPSSTTQQEHTNRS